MNNIQVLIKDLKPGMKNLNMVFIVIDIVGRPTITKDGHEIRTFRVADRSASINLTLWDEPGLWLQPGDICRITMGYTSLWKNLLTLYVSNKGGEVQRIGEFCMLFSELPNMSEPNPEFLAQVQAKLLGDQRSSPVPSLPGATLPSPQVPPPIPGVTAPMGGPMPGPSGPPGGRPPPGPRPPVSGPGNLPPTQQRQNGVNPGKRPHGRR